MLAPKNKSESTDFFKRGVYGNSIEQYEHPTEALAGTKQSFVIRYKGEPGVQGPAIFGVPRERLVADWKNLITEGWEEKRLYVNEEIDRHAIRLQGELMLTWDDGWLFRGSDDRGIHMRAALQPPHLKTWHGWQARELLRTSMDPSSWDDLNCCIDLWPDAVIELAVMDSPIGRLANTGRRLIIWEARTF